MALTDKQIRHLDAFIGSKWKSTQCPMCDQKAWDAVGHIMLPLYEANQQQTGNALPLIALACKNCGYTLFINSLFAKLPGVTK